MTPNKALEDAKSQFNPLYYNDPGKLEALLKRALGAYQDKAGVIKTVKTSGMDTFVALPENLLSVICAEDKNSRYHEVSQDEETLSVEQDALSTPPYTFHFFVNLRDYNLDEDLPPGIVGTIIDYLAALIAIPNTARARDVALATGRQIEVPTDDELNNRKSIIELYMEDNKAMIPIVSVF